MNSTHISDEEQCGIDPHVLALAGQTPQYDTVSARPGYYDVEIIDDQRVEDRLLGLILEVDAEVFLSCSLSLTTSPAPR